MLRRTMFAGSVGAMLLAASVGLTQEPKVVQGRGGSGGLFGGPGGGFGASNSMLLAMPEVQKELGLDDDQKGLLQDMQADMMEQTRSAFGNFDFQEFQKLDREERQKRMEEGRKKFEELGKKSDEMVATILEPKQAERLNQLRLQRDGVNSFTRPEVADKIGLSQERRKKVQEILESMRPDHNQFSNLIQFIFDPVTFFAMPVNVGHAITEGVETYVEVEPLDWLLVWGNHTYTRTEDLQTGRPLRRFAPNRWNAGITATPIDRLTVFIQAHVTSKQFESPTAGRNPGYYRLDVGGTFRLLGRVKAMDRLELTARIDNVTDNRYDEVFGFRALGLNALVGLRAFFR